MALWNPRSITNEELKVLEESMNKFGYVVPIIWNERTGNIVGGHQRFKVLQGSLKPDDLIEVVVVNLEDAQEKALNVALNKISGEWDEIKLSNLINQIKIEDLDLINVTGFTQDELQDLSMFNGDFKRPEFTDILEKYNIDKGKCKKNENWFYVEFYDDNKLFNALSSKVKFKGKSIHEIDANFFKDLLK
jgi:hypothetical protein